ncbi:alpha/beta-hydrolase [Pisolithus croceorrhizus]|nr:alpha/beta-hydrolase [Pisolithus croceorrhizus]
MRIAPKNSGPANWVQSQTGIRKQADRNLTSVFKGVGQEYKGSPQGKTQNLGSESCYVGTPTGKYDHKKALILLTDIFGLTLMNNPLSLQLKYSEALQNRNFDAPNWIKKYEPEVTRGFINDVVALKGQGVTSFAVTGYCFGGRYAIDLAIDQVVDVVIASHPSQVKTPETFEDFARSAEAPLLLEMGDQDREVDVKKQGEIDDILGDGKYAPGYKRECWPGCGHGFAVRADILDPQQFEGKEGSFKSSVAWLEKYF